MAKESGPRNGQPQRTTYKSQVSHNPNYTKIYRRRRCRIIQIMRTPETPREIMTTYNVSIRPTKSPL